MLKAVVAGATMTPVTQMLAACALSAVITLALWQSQSGGATVGSFVAFITAMLMLVAPVKHLSDVMAPDHARPGRGRARHRPDRAEPAERGGRHAAATPTLRARGDIRFDDVTLRYRDDTAPALDGVTLQVRGGETVALVGPSGAGKSTLVHLLPRFLEPTAGRITLDGVPLQDWDLAALRRQFALVSQDVVLFNDTVAANVALGAELPTRGGARRAARRPTCWTSSTACRRAWTRRSATTAASSRAASASGWRSRARSARTRRS